MNIDVAVVGAGPAGSAAALHLASNGIAVALLEKAAMPRYKTCGGGVLSRAFQLMPANVTSAVERECRVAELNFGKRLRFVTQRPMPIVYMTMRPALDHALAMAAEAAGATFRDCSPVTDIRALEDTVVLTTPRHSYRARFVIAADGATSFVARRSGWRSRLEAVPALECEVHPAQADLAQFGRTARFDFGHVPHGYAWVFPKQCHLSIGVLTMQRTTCNLRQIIGAYMNDIGLRPPAHVERHGYVIPVRPRREPLAANRIFLVGDAAGLVDPVTAEGISHALISGRDAAEALLESSLKPGLSERSYQARLKQNLLRELRAARLLAWLLFDCPRLSEWMFARYGQSLCEAVTDIVMGGQTYRGLLADLGGMRMLRRLVRSPNTVL